MACRTIRYEGLSEPGCNTALSTLNPYLINSSRGIFKDDGIGHRDSARDP